MRDMSDAERKKLSHRQPVASELMKSEANKNETTMPVGSGDWLGVRSTTNIKNMTETKTCNCWHEKDNKLREMGYKISDACSMLQIKDLNLTAKFGLPLQRTDGGKLKRDDAKMITISHCPFCGVALTPNEKS